MKIDWKKKLSSRKFWLAVVGFVSNILILVGVAETEIAQITAAIMSGAVLIAYIISEGMIDAQNAADSSPVEMIGTYKESDNGSDDRVSEE